VSTIDPSRSYVVCATPRSGSTLLCQSLVQTGAAGRPEEFFEARRGTGVPRHGREWFEGTALDLDAFLDDDRDPQAPSYSDLRGISYDEHLRRTLELGTTPNGVFAAKVMWGHLDDPQAFLRDLIGGEPRWAWVRRYDTARQAISLWKAIQTGTWRKEAPGEERREPQFSFAAIDHLVTLLTEHDTAWAQFFAGRGIEPLTFRYRDIAADPAGATRAVLAHAGIDEEPEAMPQPRMERQADALNDAWLSRYNELRSPAA